MRGLKFHGACDAMPCLRVAPFMGAWIEIISNRTRLRPGWKSHPSWVRGLKYNYHLQGTASGYVAPFMGAWIEIVEVRLYPSLDEVAPFMGAWIEIRVRPPDEISAPCRTLHGCVD